MWLLNGCFALFVAVQRLRCACSTADPHHVKGANGSGTVYLSGNKVREHSSAVERGRPNVAISPAMLRSSNGSGTVYLSGNKASHEHTSKHVAHEKYKSVKAATKKIQALQEELASANAKMARGRREGSNERGEHDFGRAKTQDGFPGLGTQAKQADASAEVAALKKKAAGDKQRHDSEIASLRAQLAAAESATAAAAAAAAPVRTRRLDSVGAEVCSIERSFRSCELDATVTNPEDY